jgi:hypothetical protein
VSEACTTIQQDPSYSCIYSYSHNQHVLQFLIKPLPAQSLIHGLVLLLPPLVCVRARAVWPTNCVFLQQHAAVPVRGAKNQSKQNSNLLIIVTSITHRSTCHACLWSSSATISGLKDGQALMSTRTRPANANMQQFPGRSLLNLNLRPNYQPVRLAGGWWLVLICCERKVLLAGCWWLICSDRKVLLAGGW